MIQKKILVADDEKDIVELIAYNLEQEGFAVCKAFDGRKAWEMVHADKPDKETPQYILTVRGIGYKFADISA